MCQSTHIIAHDIALYFAHDTALYFAGMTSLCHANNCLPPTNIQAGKVQDIGSSPETVFVALLRESEVP